jgi:hypothetical protein
MRYDILLAREAHFVDAQTILRPPQASRAHDLASDLGMIARISTLASETS